MSLILGLLEQVLGPAEKGSRDNMKFICPFHVSNPPGKRKLEVDINTDENGLNKYKCWVCEDVKGKTIKSLFRKMNVGKELLDQLKKLIKPGAVYKPQKFNGLLPEEYVFLPDAKPADILAKHARVYLKKRGVTVEDIYRYQIGYCDDGMYAESVIIPSYDAKGVMNFFIARSFDDNAWRKYKYPEVSRDIIPFELFINWNQPVILCEGAFDMLAIKRNCIPLLGKSVTNNLMKKLIESKVKKMYIALDNDALKMALKHCETFLSYGKKVFLVELPEKDPSSMGFEEFTKHIQNAKPLTLSRIMQLKLSMI